MAKIQPRAGFWPQLDKTWSEPRVLGQHSLEGRVLGQHSLEGCCGRSLERRTGHSLERRTGHSLEGRCAVALDLCRGPDPWTVARSRRDMETYAWNQWGDQGSPTPNASAPWREN